MKDTCAILYLETLRLVTFETAGDAERARAEAYSKEQPFVTLSRRDKCWKVMQTCYFGKVKQ